jgi:segregation and condensation protein A
MTEAGASADDLPLFAPAADLPPLARVRGEPMSRLPEDLYIPPDALEVILDAFEGPLDLLLYLIRKQNLDILDIPVLSITQQYVAYIDLMQGLRLELAAEYLVMAALLAEIKSRILLPRPPPTEEGEAEDPRMELVRRLQAYERFKTAAEQIDAVPRVGRDRFIAAARVDAAPAEGELPQLALRELLLAMQQVLSRAVLYTHHRITREPLSVRARMSHVLQMVQAGPQPFEALLDPAEGKPGVVVCFLAVLELVKRNLIELVQDAPFQAILLDRAHPQNNSDDAA